MNLVGRVGFLSFPRPYYTLVSFQLRVPIRVSGVITFTGATEAKAVHTSTCKESRAESMGYKRKARITFQADSDQAKPYFHTPPVPKPKGIDSDQLTWQKSR